MSSRPWSHLILWSHGLVRSHDQLKSLYHHYYSAYGQQTWQHDNLPCWALAYKVTWVFDQVALRYHVTNWNHYVFTIRVPMAKKLSRMVTYLNGLLPIKPHGSLITLSSILVIIIWNSTIFYYRCDWPQVNENFISSIANLAYELPRELPNDLRFRILGN